MSTTTPTSTLDPAASAGTNTGSSDARQVPAPVSGEKTYSQSEVESLIKERLLRQQQTLEGQANAAREKAEREAAEQKAKEQGEYQKLAETEKARADKAEAEKQSAEQTMRDRLIRTEIKAVAVTLGFAAKPEVLHRLVDFAAVEFNAQGDPTNVEALLKKLATDEPYLVGGGQQGGAHIPGTPNASQLTEEQSIAAAAETLRKTGRYAG